MKTQLTLIYWQSEAGWLGKLLEHPEIVAEGATLKELEENVTDAYLSMVLDDVPDGYQTKTIQCDIPTGPTTQTAGVGGFIRSAAGKVRDASRKGVDTASSAIAEGSKTGFRKIADTAASVAESARDASQKASDMTSVSAEQMKTGSRKIADTAASAAESVQDASKEALDKVPTATEQVKIGSRKTLDAAISAANTLLTSTQGLLATSLADDLNDLLQNAVKGPTTIYDKVMDAEYIASHAGGDLHRLFDGGHTIAGAFKAAREASPDDNIIQEALGTLQGLLRDATTPMGLPLANWNPETFNRVAGALESNFYIPKDWFYDLNTYDAAELLGGAIGIVALVLNWNQADTESFAKLVGGMGVSAAFDANPLLLVVTVVALAKAFHKAHQTGEYAEFVDGQVKGALGTLVTVSVVGVVGGPTGTGLLVGLVVGVLVNRATENVSVVQIGQFLAEQAIATATKTKEIALTQKQRWDTTAARGLEFQSG